MALNISGIVSAVNNYLYSISDVANGASDSQSTTKTGLGEIFQKYLKKATEDTKSASEAEDTQAVAETVKAVSNEKNVSDSTASDVIKPVENSAEASINNVFENLDLKSEILNNISARSVDLKSEITKNIASHTVDIKSELVDNMAQHNRIDKMVISAVTESDASSTATDGDASANFDAYNGLLSSSALQQLANSAYFSSNLIQSSIIDAVSENENGDTSLSDLNSNSLSANNLGAAGQGLTQSDYAAALIKAYKNSPSTSIFGDFQL